MINLKEVINLAKEEKSYAVLDFDNTCIINDIGEAVLAYMCENDLLKKRGCKKTFQTYYKLLETKNIRKIKQACKLLIQTFEGFSKNEIKSITQKVIKFEGNKIKKRNLFGVEIAKGITLKSEIKEIIQSLNKNNIQVWIVSASPKICVKETFKYFFPTNKANIIGFENKLEKEIFTKELVSPFPLFEGKVQCIKKYINKKIKPILAIGDSENDKKMLEYSKIKLVVNRDNSLSQLAKQKGWDNI